MIRRTQFPLDETAINLYKQSLAKLSPSDQAFVLREGALLSEYADKCSGYCVNQFESSWKTVQGLANEMRAVGAPVDSVRKLDTPSFLSNNILDFGIDEKTTDIKKSKTPF